MALVVGTNLLSLNALHRLGRTQRDLGGTFERISSGQRINRAADDAAGFGMAERFDAEKRSLRQAMRRWPSSKSSSNPASPCSARPTR
jgi:flagellin